MNSRVLSRSLIGFCAILAALGAKAQLQPAASQPPAATTPGAALLRVYRQRRYAGSALAPSIYVDDRQIARIGNGRRISVKLLPGTHSIRSDDKSSAISVDAVTGQEYFVRVDEAMGFWKGHGKLTMLLPEQGSAEYKLEKPVEEDRKIARDLIEDDALIEGTSGSGAPGSTQEASTEGPGLIKVSFTSIPDGADIEVDGNFVGSTPSSVELAPGDHAVAIKRAGYATWDRKLKVMGGDIKLNANLERQ